MAKYGTQTGWGKMSRDEGDRPLESPRNKFGGFRGLSRGKLIFFSPEPKKIVFGGFPGGNKFRSVPPNIKIGVLCGGGGINLWSFPEQLPEQNCPGEIYFYSPPELLRFERRFERIFRKHCYQSELKF